MLSEHVQSAKTESESAEEILARELHASMERRDPTPGNEDWDLIACSERDFYRGCIRDIMFTLTNVLKTRQIL